MSAEQNPGPGLATTIHHWWKERSAHDGFFPTLKRFVSTLWEFTRESTPSRRRQRYGDVEFDWDFRVDTTSATVGWRDRLLGLFHSPYQPTEPALFREMLASLMLASPKIAFREKITGGAALTSSAVDLAKHVGHKVTVTGTFKPESYEKEKGEKEVDEKAPEAGDIRVTNLKMVSDSCK